MFHGFYNLASQMICEKRNMNVIGNNIVNATTPGYKKDTFVATTFQEQLVNRTQHSSKISEQIGTTQMMRTGKVTTTDYAQGGFELTDEKFDFALGTSGFFQIQKSDGTVVYTRNGSFYMDDDGYLALQGVGRVLGQNGEIYLGQDNITADNHGNIYDTQGNFYGQISIRDFEDYDSLLKNDNGTYTSSEEGIQKRGLIQWKALETSNVNPVIEMTQMMSGQRSLQSSAQMLRMYDQLMGKIVSDIGKL